MRPKPVLGQIEAVREAHDPRALAAREESRVRRRNPRDQLREAFPHLEFTAATAANGSVSVLRIFRPRGSFALMGMLRVVWLWPFGLTSPEMGALSLKEHASELIIDGAYGLSICIGPCQPS